MELWHQQGIALFGLNPNIDEEDDAEEAEIVEEFPTCSRRSEEQVRFEVDRIEIFKFDVDRINLFYC